MSRKWMVVAAIALGVPAAWWLAQLMSSRILPVTPPGDGISRSLASTRAANISAVRYALSFDIPESRTGPIRGTVAIRLRLARRTAVILDFAQPADRIASVRANDTPVPVQSEHGHLVVPAEPLRAGENTIEIAFTAGDAALNRHDEFLYSLFVPARASQTFPCFDQPDIKGSFALTLELPAGWMAVSNAPEIARTTAGDRTTLRFGQTQALPTYVFGFAAGLFTAERGERGGRAFTLYHRETDAAKVAANLEAIFDLHQQALDWLETYTSRRYPFEKLDFVLLPAFQFSGMEHAGAIYYNAPALLLDKTATQTQELWRANLIAHETSHMWFGDLVTMRWFDDVWLKEVFANFMAAQIVNPSFPDIDHELRFFVQHYPQAYEVDRTSGTNPIRQTLENLRDAGSLYGAIIYQKAPIVMRQLEQMLGPDQLRDGLRDYLTRFAFGNATWTDVIDILDARTDEDLAAWSRAWVDEPGRPTIATTLTLDGGTVRRITLSQSDPRGRGLVWAQQLHVALGYDHGARLSTVNMNAASVDLPRVEGLPPPHYILPNAEGIGYGLFRLDDRSKRFFLERLPEVGDGLTRGVALATLWDDVLEGGTRPGELLDLTLRALPAETDELNVSRMLDYAEGLFWRFLPASARDAVAGRLETVLREGLSRSKTSSLKSAYFGAFRRVVTRRDGLEFLERVWRRTEAVPGLSFAETDEIQMAEELALRQVADSEAILRDQHGRITNPDRRARFAFVMPALSPDAAARDAFFERLARPENRAQERWVTDGLRFLNHPARRPASERYIRPSLEMLDEIQRTGDIFFPLDWTGAVLDGHNSRAAADEVAGFLAAREDYPPRLRRIVEQKADKLFRAARIVQ